MSIPIENTAIEFREVSRRWLLFLGLLVIAWGTGVFYVYGDEAPGPAGLVPLAGIALIAAWFLLRAAVLVIHSHGMSFVLKGNVAGGFGPSDARQLSNLILTQVESSRIRRGKGDSATSGHDLEIASTAK